MKYLTRCFRTLSQELTQVDTVSDGGGWHVPHVRGDGGFLMSEMVLILQSFLSAGHTVYDAWSRYRDKRNRRRMDQVHEYLRNRVTNLEECIQRLGQQPAEADLFMVTLHSLIQDDEEAKTGFYAAFLEHLLMESTDRAELRCVAECFKSLSAAELNYLAGADDSGKLPNIPEDWIEVSLPARLQSLGLFLDPSHSAYNTRLTSVGLLARVIAMEGKNAFASQGGEGSSQQAQR